LHVGVGFGESGDVGDVVEDAFGAVGVDPVGESVPVGLAGVVVVVCDEGGDEAACLVDPLVVAVST
jgi:hypothetical protein